LSNKYSTCIILRIVFLFNMDLVKIKAALYLNLLSFKATTYSLETADIIKYMSMT